jgi:SAM-dependent methyltransferase
MAPISEIFWFLLDPWLFMSEALMVLPFTIVGLVKQAQFATLFTPSKLQAAWFGDFWATAGPGVRETGEARVIPLLEGYVAGGNVVTKPQYESMSGTVIEVGPGTGMWLSVFSKLHTAGKGITRIYGVEPNKGVHAALRKNAVAAGLQDTYQVVPHGIEDLASSGTVARESVDCIVSILCLCSIPDPQHNIKELFGYLKPGGRWYVYEHVRCESERMRECGLFMRAYQGECKPTQPGSLMFSNSCMRPCSARLVR